MSRLARGILVAWLGSGVPAGAIACPSSGQETARVAAVEPRLELRLDDGRVLRLAGLDPALPTPNDPDLAERVRMRFAARLVGRTVGVRLLADRPDRWGRRPALAFALDAAPAVPGGLAVEAVGAGSGRFLVEPAASDCRRALVEAEQKARLATLGLWADPYYAVMAVDDHAGFIERSGTIVVAMGRLTAVQPGPYRTTLRFAPSAGAASARAEPHGGHMLVATIMPREMKAFLAQGVDLNSLVGTDVRFRGLLDLRFGPRIELASPDDVEPVAPLTDARRSAAH